MAEVTHRAYSSSSSTGGLSKMAQYGPLKLFSGTTNPLLAQEIADYLGTPLGTVYISRFANGEIYIRFEESIRGADVFIIQSFAHDVNNINDSIMELLIMIDALKRASAGRITAVIPYYCYARQEKKISAPGTHYRPNAGGYHLHRRRGPNHYHGFTCPRDSRLL